MDDTGLSCVMGGYVWGGHTDPMVYDTFKESYIPLHRSPSERLSAGHFESTLIRHSL